MSKRSFLEYTKGLKAPAKTKIRLKKYDTLYDPKGLSDEECVTMLNATVEKLSRLQDKLYAHNKYSILIILQAMDAAGKDSTVKHIMSGLNPQGVKVTSFKTPSSTELDHDYIWRHYQALPPRGEIGIFNRSHYENVLVTRIHPEYLLNENLPDVRKPAYADNAFWEKRYKQINRFEKHLVENGTIVLKFFLHLSKDEQKKRFLERIDDPKKNWKFSFADLKERARWDDYQNAYEEMISKTSTEHAPWFIIPADHKPTARIAISELILREFEKLHIHYPIVTAAQKEELIKAKEALMSE